MVFGFRTVKLQEPSSAELECADGSCSTVVEAYNPNGELTWMARDLLEKQKILPNITLIPLDCSFGMVKEKQSTALSISKMAKYHCKRDKTKVTIVVALRRPGCLACRETALLLKEYYESDKDVSLAGIVKESGTNIIKDAILELYSEYYPFPLYKDEKWATYKEILGNRKGTYFDLVTKMLKMKKRLSASGKAIKGTYMGGDSLTAGGILILDRDGNLRHVLCENFGSPLEREVIQEAIDNAKVRLHSSGQGHK